MKGNTHLSPVNTDVINSEIHISAWGFNLFERFPSSGAFCDSGATSHFKRPGKFDFESGCGRLCRPDSSGEQSPLRLMLGFRL